MVVDLSPPLSTVSFLGMSTLAEIEAAVEKLSVEQQRRLLFLLTARLHDGRTVRSKARRGLKAATYPALDGLPQDLSVNTKDKVRALVNKRHAANR